MKALYLDHNATTPIDPRVLAEVMRCFQEEYGNAGSPHDYGVQAKEMSHRARDQIGKIVNARRHEVIFTSGATESNNLAILGLAEYGRSTNRKHIVSSQIEHKAVLEPLSYLKSQGFDVTLVPPDCDGVVYAARILDAVRDDTLLVSLMHVNNETGAIQPIGQIAEGLKDRSNVYIHVDAAQSFGKYQQDLDHDRIDMISISSHKINGPVGVGALVTRKRGTNCIPLAPLMFGGGQEMGLRPGTLPVALIAGFGLAAELADRERLDRSRRCLELRELVQSKLAVLNPTYVAADAPRLPHVVCVAFDGWDADSLIEELTGIASISTGSACTSICATASHVLSAMKVPSPALDGAVRISWSHTTDRALLEQSLDRMVDLLLKRYP